MLLDASGLWAHAMWGDQSIFDSLVSRIGLFMGIGDIEKVKGNI